MDCQIHWALAYRSALAQCRSGVSHCFAGTRCWAWWPNSFEQRPSPLNMDENTLFSAMQLVAFQDLPGGFLSLSGASSQTIPLKYDHSSKLWYVEPLGDSQKAAGFEAQQEMQPLQPSACGKVSLPEICVRQSPSLLAAFRSQQAVGQTFGALELTRAFGPFAGSRRNIRRKFLTGIERSGKGDRKAGRSPSVAPSVATCCHKLERLGSCHRRLFAARSQHKHLAEEFLTCRKCADS